MAQSLLSQCRLLASMKADSTFNYGRPPYWQRKPNPHPHPPPPPPPPAPPGAGPNPTPTQPQPNPNPPHPNPNPPNPNPPLFFLKRRLDCLSPSRLVFHTSSSS
jgi:hypothetical protein